MLDKHFIGTRYYKALYHEYDATFQHKKARFHWQGNMGPILRAQVGDTIEIHFWNRAKQNFTMHPHVSLLNFIFIACFGLNFCIHVSF